LTTILTLTLDDGELPNQALMVTLSVAGDEIITEAASLFRNDLLCSGKGDGKHGFVLNVDQRLPMEVLDQLRVDCRSPSGEVTTLSRVSDAVIDETAIVNGPERQISPIVGYFEIILPSELRGWAYNPENPDEHLTVDVLIDGKHISSTSAADFRPDLVSAWVGNGDHAFAFETREELTNFPIGSLEVVARSVTGVRGSLEQLKESSAQTRTAQIETPTPVFPGPSQDLAHHPVFILGAARFGTSAIAQVLIKSTRYAG
jgi:hypothetical protein